MKKLIMVLVMAVTLVLVGATGVSAVTIDGAIGSGEWDGAIPVSVAGSKGTVSVIAETDYLYVLLDLNEPNDARTSYPGEVGNDQTSINVNPTDGGSWGFPYDLIFETSALSVADGGHHMLPWNPKVNSGTLDGWATRWFPNNAQETLPGDLASSTSYSGGKRITEWKLPLSLFGYFPGEELKVGGAVDVGDGGSYVYPIGLNWNDASTFQTISIPVLRSAEITSPDLGEYVSGNVDFEAYLIDDDHDAVQWAVRRGTCAAGTNTVFGNVDGHSDFYSWSLTDTYRYDFSATADTSAWIPGMYCFIFNPEEDAGETDIRLTREFYLRDTVAPLVTIENPHEGDIVSGTVEIYGTVVEDYLLSHYNISVYPGDANFNDFSKRIAQATVNRSTGFTNELIFEWDSTGWDDGEYLIRLAARDSAGNRSYDGDPYLGGDDSQHVIRIIIDNAQKAEGRGCHFERQSRPRWNCDQAVLKIFDGKGEIVLDIGGLFSGEWEITMHHKGKIVEIYQGRNADGKRILVTINHKNGKVNAFGRDVWFIGSLVE